MQNEAVLKSSKKVVRCRCGECGYSGDMVFLKYKWNFFQRHGLLIVIAILLDAVLTDIIPSGVLIVVGMLFVSAWIYIAKMPKYVQCPNCGKTLYSVSAEEVVDNPFCEKSHI